MFYHALTGGNTPTEDLSPILLWENSNPTAEFDAQTVSLDLSNYIGVIIECLSTTTKENLTSRVYIKKGETLIGGCNTESYPNVRLITAINNQGVSFGIARDSNTHNDHTIPYRIYGVKEYVVEPQIGNLLWTNANPTASFGAQKISVDLTNAKGAIIECMVSSNSQLNNTRALIYKGEAPFGIGYSAGTTASSRNVTAVENDGVTFATGYVGSSEENGVIIPYKIYAIN